MKLKNTDIHFIYALLFFILGNTEDTLWLAVVSDITAIGFSIMATYYAYKDAKKGD
jgi:putative Ca2+/H+ antiporter (TMEM165/GDT1 family)